MKKILNNNFICIKLYWFLIKLRDFRLWIISLLRKCGLSDCKTVSRIRKPSLVAVRLRSFVLSKSLFPLKNYQDYQNFTKLTEKIRKF